MMIIRTLYAINMKSDPSSLSKTNKKMINPNNLTN
jgi:hypothetical protein